jgi:hypothetical protein
MSDLTLRDAMRLSGASAKDLAWFDSIGWSDSNVPAAEAASLADYERRETMLNACVDGLTFAERGNAQAGRLAAAIGARIADFRDRQEDDGDED